MNFMKMIYKILIEIGFVAIGVFATLYGVYVLFREPEKIIMKIIGGK